MDEFITLNNKEYLIVKRINYNSNNYLYVISTGGDYKVALLKEINQNGQVFVESVKDQREFGEVLELVS